MKRSLATLLSVAAILAIALAADKLSVSKLVKDADKYDGKEVVLVGKISEFEQKTSRRGNKYFLFKVKEGDDVVNGYSQGEMKPELKAGDKVEVSGIFRKEKKVQDFTVKNEIDATKVKDKSYGVKKVD